MESPKEKQMENEMEIGLLSGLYLGRWATCLFGGNLLTDRRNAGPPACKGHGPYPTRMQTCD